MQMGLAIILASLWFIMYTLESITFQHAAIGLIFTGVLAVNAVYDKVDTLVRKEK